MDNFIGNNIQIIAHWGQFIMGLVNAAFIGLWYLTNRRNRYFLPKGILGYLGSTMLFLLILLSSLIFVRITMIKPGVLAILDQLDAIKGQTAELTFQLTKDHTTQTLAAYQNQVVLLNFWATWCAPCRKEMPDLNRLQDEFREQGLTVIALSDEQPERIQNFERSNPPSLVSAYVKSFEWVNMGSERPVTFLINRNGKVVDYFTGGYDFSFFASKVKPLL